MERRLRLQKEGPDSLLIQPKTKKLGTVLVNIVLLKLRNLSLFLSSFIPILIPILEAVILYICK